jgi:opacity protein-like surface antigen
MKKILLSTALTAAMLSPVAAESFSGMFAGAKGSILLFNKGGLSDLTKTPLDKDTKDYGGFGFNGGYGGVELGYAFRFANNFAMGFSLGGGYKHSTIKEARDTEVGADKKALGLDFITSGFSTEARLRLGLIFSRFHVYLNPGMELGMSNPELTVYYKGAGDNAKDETHKVTYAPDKGPEWKDRLSFVVGLNVEYAVTQTMFVGGGIGFRYGLADVKDQKGNFSTETTAKADVVTDIAYKNPMGVDVGVVIGASF